MLEVVASSTPYRPLLIVAKQAGDVRELKHLGQLRPPALDRGVEMLRLPDEKRSPAVPADARLEAIPQRIVLPARLSR